MRATSLVSQRSDMVYFTSKVSGSENERIQKRVIAGRNCVLPYAEPSTCETGGAFRGHGTGAGGFSRSGQRTGLCTSGSGKALVFDCPFRILGNGIDLEVSSQVTRQST